MNKEKIYYLNPKVCLKCKIDLPYTQRRNKFCSLSCSASFNNSSRGNLKFCLNCTSKLSWRTTKYCNRTCEIEYKYKTHIQNWKLGLDKGYTESTFDLTTRIRRYIFDKYNHQCARCSWKEINPYSGRSPLHIDHIDGNVSNAKEENLILLCPNCHSLTSTWGTLNMGNGRKSLKKN